jgi:prepilin-type N-terminal cleavage/methylation domain-containing protein
MLKQQLKKRNDKGFTIIEVLIVLAIAGLILLIVFLAVPALQRNSRNTQRNNDVAGMIGAWNEQNNNSNGGAPPTKIVGTATTCTAAAICCSGATGTPATSTGPCVFLTNVKTGWYTTPSATDLIYYYFTAAPTGPTGGICTATTGAVGAANSPLNCTTGGGGQIQNDLAASLDAGTPGSNVILANYMGCDPTGTYPVAGSGPRNSAFIYAVETGSGWQAECKTAG